MLARQNKVTDDGYPIVYGSLTPVSCYETKWSFRWGDLPADQMVVLELDDGTRSEPFQVLNRKGLTIPCKRMGRILPGRNSHLFGI